MIRKRHGFSMVEWVITILLVVSVCAGVLYAVFTAVSGQYSLFTSAIQK